MLALVVLTESRRTQKDILSRIFVRRFAVFFCSRRILERCKLHFWHRLAKASNGAEYQSAIVRGESTLALRSCLSHRYAQRSIANYPVQVSSGDISIITTNLTMIESLF